MTAQASQYIINIAEKLCKNAKEIRYGTVTASLNIHNGRVVDVTHTVTESKREKEEDK